MTETIFTEKEKVMYKIDNINKTQNILVVFCYIFLILIVFCTIDDNMKAALITGLIATFTVALPLIVLIVYEYKIKKKYNIFLK
jgi:hypothetical protein